MYTEDGLKLSTTVTVLHTVLNTEKSTFCQASQNCNNPSLRIKGHKLADVFYTEVPCGVSEKTK